MTQVIVLGGGPAGLGAALELAEAGADVDLIERGERVGGNAGSFELAGVHVDFGSHRLHPASDPQVLARIRDLLGDDLLARPRHGRIRLLGRWLHFPLRPVDLMLRVHPKFAFGVGLDLASGLLPKSPPPGPENFATVLRRGLGRTICREFYFPYAKKIWGVDPSELSAEQARRRVSANSIGRMIRRLLPGGTGSGSGNTKGIFYYPRRGFGQISERIAEAAEQAGARIRLRTEVKGVALGRRPSVELECDGKTDTLHADWVYSTIPLTVLTRLASPAAPAEIAAATERLEFRAMMLVYLVLEQDQFTEYDAHYFPDIDLPFTRLSEPKNYSASSEPKGRTVLCAEIPCMRSDALWAESDEALRDLVAEGLGKAGLPVSARISAVHVERIPFAYPLYRDGYEANFDAIDAWLGSQEGVLHFGRQGLYAHDNTHHALYMAHAAARCLAADGSFDRAEWERERAVFATHVVED